MPCDATRRRAARAAALLFLAGTATAVFPARALAAAGLTPRESSFLEAVNSARGRHALRPVVVDPHLERAARTYSAAMIRTGVFRHGRFLQRLVRFGADGPIVGENLGWTIDDSAATGRIVSWWLRSRVHRAVLLRPGFRRIGIGVARGPFQGRPHCIVVTADFEGR